MPKRDPYTKTKMMIVSSRSLFGRKTEMEKQIEKWEAQGWTVTHNRPVKGNKNKHELTFEYKMSEHEIDAKKKRDTRNGLGCLGLIVLFIVYSNISSNNERASVAATQQFLAQASQTAYTYIQATNQQVAMNETATATLWTPTYTPTPTDTPTATLTPTVTNTPTLTPIPSNTFTPTVTFTPSPTFTPSLTSTVTPSATITNTPKPSNTPIPRTPTPKPATSAPPQTYYTTGNANVRSCPKTTCDIVNKLPAGSSIPIIGAEQGDTVSGSNVWRKTIISGQTGYIHSSLLSVNVPAPKPVQAQAPAQQAPVQQSIEQQPGLVSTVPPVPVVSFSPNCNGEVYDCKDLTCSQMAIYWAACPGDPSGLDGNDNDGRYCESKCG